MLLPSTSTASPTLTEEEAAGGGMNDNIMTQIQTLLFAITINYASLPGISAPTSDSKGLLLRVAQR